MIGRTRDLKLKQVVFWRGKPIDETMEKAELIFIIECLADRIKALESGLKQAHNLKARSPD